MAAPSLRAGSDGSRGRRTRQSQRLVLVLLALLAVLVLAIGGVLLAGGPSPTPSHISAVSPTPGPTGSAASPSATASATAFGSPTSAPTTPPPTAAPPTATPTVAPTAEPALSKLLIRWINPPGASGLDDLLNVNGSAQMGGRYVISGSRKSADPQVDELPAIWWSDDGAVWHRAQLPTGYETRSVGVNVQVTAAGPGGFVAFGQPLPLWSTDGKTWSDSSASLEADAHFAGIAATGNGWLGLVRQGEGETATVTAYTSADGHSWQKGNEITELSGPAELHLGSWNDALLVFASRDVDGKSTAQLWQTTDFQSWDSAGQIKGYVTIVAAGPVGLVAAGYDAQGHRAIWVSADGSTWQHAPTVPGGAVMALAVDKAGFIAAVSVLPAGCVIDNNEIVGQTWTSVDGFDWQLMKQHWQGRWMDALFIADRTLVGVGEAHANGDFGWVRTAPLPETMPVAGPTPTAQPTPTPPPTC